MKVRKLIACGLALAITAGLTACAEEEPISGNNALSGLPAQTTTTMTTTDPDENAPTDREVKQVSTEEYAPDGNAGVVKYFGYYDIAVDQKGTEQTLIFQSDLYGGSWTRSSAEIAPIIEAALDEYRR